MVVENQQDLMVDSRLHTINPLAQSTLEKLGLAWFNKGENKGYLCNDFVRVNTAELDQLKAATFDVQALMIEAARHVAAHNLWEEAGIPAEAVELVKWSLENELDNHLVGRYDFAGGLMGTPIKLLEFNADTCSLMPETSLIQYRHWEQERNALSGQPLVDLPEDLIHRFASILKRYPDKEPNLLISTLGFQEDWLNADVIARAAKRAGFREVQFMALERVLFSTEEGIFMELGKDHYQHFDFWFKFIPWEFICFEEPDLLTDLSEIILNDLCVVLNPAYTMLLQSKAIMKYMYELEPNNPYILKTSYQVGDFPNHQYVRKPQFGRMGENIAIFDGTPSPAYETEGDYGDFPSIYQEVAAFDIDREGHRYQPSIFWTGEPSALCFRRQDDLIIDDDAEFVGHVIKD